MRCIDYVVIEGWKWESKKNGNEVCFVASTISCGKYEKEGEVKMGELIKGQLQR